MKDADPDKKKGASHLGNLLKEMAELSVEREALDIEFQKHLGKHRDLKQRMTGKLSEIKQASLELRKKIDSWSAPWSRAGYGDLTQHILDLINGNPARIWTNVEIFRNIESTASRTTFNATLNRLFKTGKIERVVHGRYRALSKSEDIGIDSQ